MEDSNTDKDKVPKKETKKSVKKPIKKSTNIPKITEKPVDSLIRELITKQLKEEKEKKNLEIESLNSVIEEFLKTFMIIGYDLDSRPVVIINAKTQLDADALSSALTRVFMESNKPPHH